MLSDGDMDPEWDDEKVLPVMDITSLQVLGTARNSSQEDAEEELPPTLTARSLKVLLQGSRTPGGTQSVAENSWTSSLATPAAGSCVPQDISQLNTEERKVFLPSDGVAKDQTPSDATVWDDEMDVTSGRKSLSVHSNSPSFTGLSKRLFSPGNRINNISLSMDLSSQECALGQSFISTSLLQEPQESGKVPAVFDQSGLELLDEPEDGMFKISKACRSTPIRSLPQVPKFEETKVTGTLVVAQQDQVPERDEMFYRPPSPIISLKSRRSKSRKPTRKKEACRESVIEAMPCSAASTSYPKVTTTIVPGSMNSLNESDEDLSGELFSEKPSSPFHSTNIQSADHASVAVIDNDIVNRPPSPIFASRRQSPRQPRTPVSASETSQPQYSSQILFSSQAADPNSVQDRPSSPIFASRRQSLRQPRTPVSAPETSQPQHSSQILFSSQAADPNSVQDRPSSPIFASRRQSPRQPRIPVSAPETSQPQHSSQILFSSQAADSNSFQDQPSSPTFASRRQSPRQPKTPVSAPETSQPQHSSQILFSSQAADPNSFQDRPSSPIFASRRQSPRQPRIPVSAPETSQPQHSSPILFPGQPADPSPVQDEVVSGEIEIPVLNQPPSPIYGIKSRNARRRRQMHKLSLKQVQAKEDSPKTSVEGVDEITPIPDQTTPEPTLIVEERAPAEDLHIKKEYLETKQSPKLPDIDCRIENASEVELTPVVVEVPKSVQEEIIETPMDSLDRHDLELDKLNKDVAALLDTMPDQQLTPKTLPVVRRQINSRARFKKSVVEDHGITLADVVESVASVPSTSKSSVQRLRKIQFTNRLGQKLEIADKNSSVNHENKIAAPKRLPSLLYPNVSESKPSPSVTTSDLKQSALNLEKAVMKPRQSPSTLVPSKRTDIPVPFCQMKDPDKEEEETDANEDMELLMLMMETEEKLFGSRSLNPPLTSPSCAEPAPCSKNESEYDSPIRPSGTEKTEVAATKSSDTPLTRKFRLGLCSTPIVGKTALPEFNTTPISRGLATDSGKKVSLSEHAMLRAQQFVKQENLPALPEVDEADDSHTLEPKKLFCDAQAPCSVEFATVRGIKPETALMKAQQMFGDEKLPQLPAIQDNNSLILGPKNDSDGPGRAFVGFSTAAGKKIPVSDAVIMKGKKIFGTLELDSCIEPVSLFEEEPVTTFQESMTDSERKIVMGLAAEEPILSPGGDALLQLQADSLTKTLDSGKTTKEESCSIDDSLMEHVQELEQNALKSMAMKQGASKGNSQLGETSKGGALEENPVKKSQEQIAFDDQSSDLLFAEFCQSTEKIDSPRNQPEGSFGGFFTSRGKKIEVSEKDLLAGKQRLLSGLETDMRNNAISPKSDFSISKRSSEKSDTSAPGSVKKLIIGSMDQEFGDLVEEEVVEQTCSSFVAPVSFSTVSGKKIQISEEALRTTKQKFMDLELDNDNTAVMKFQGFSFASGSKVNVSEEAVRAAHKRFEDSETEKTAFQGFSTVAGKNVKISERSLTVTKRRFQDIDDIELRPPLMQGFSMAGGRKVTISEEAINAAKKRFEDLEPSSTSRAPRSFEFSTAGGKKVEVSEKAIEAAKKRFEYSEIKAGNSSPAFQGLSTATGKKIEISKEAVLAAKRKFEEVDASTPQTSNQEFPDKKIKVSLTNSAASPATFNQVKESPFTPAREQQLKTIAAKKKYSVKSTPGTILKIRRSGVSLMSLRGIPLSSQCCRPEVIDMTAVSASAYRFQLQDVTTCADGATLVPSNSGDVGPEEVEAAFLASPGVDPALVPPGGWVKNHYRWIVWKLAATERRFPATFEDYLNLEYLMAQLKFRYDREVDLAQRPALRRITERDSAPGTRMILCVAEIAVEHLILTDGWYQIRAYIDNEMKSFVQQKIVTEGTKLVIHGAEMVGKSSGCHPLQQPPDMALKIFTNSTRRARWDSMLGFCQCPGPLRIGLGSVRGYGGVVGDMLCRVAQVYPLLYAEHGKDGVKMVVRSERAEKAQVARYEVNRQKVMDKIVSEEKTRLGKEKDRDMAQRRMSLSSHAVDKFDGESICLALEADPDLHSSLTESQCELAAEWSREDRERWSRTLDSRIRERVAAECSQRSISPLVRIRLIPMDSPGPSALLTIWRPIPDLLKILQTPNLCLRLIGCVASGRRDGEICLNSTKNSKIIQLTPKPLPASLMRGVTPLSALDELDFKPLFNEVDLVGIVSKIEPVQNNMQMVTLCDSEGYEIVISFWNGLEGHGLSQLLVPGVSIAACNLQWRHGLKKKLSCNSASLSCLQASMEKSHFSRDPTEQYLKDALQKLRSTLYPEIIVKNVRNPVAPVVEIPTVDEPAKDVVRKIDALRRYGEPPPLSPLPAMVNRRLCQSFRPPARVDDDSENSSPPMSLSSE